MIAFCFLLIIHAVHHRYPVSGYSNSTAGGGGGVLQAYRSGERHGHGHGHETLKGSAKWLHELKALTSRSWKTFVRTRYVIWTLEWTIFHCL